MFSSMGSGGLTDKQERAVLLIINTADYCSQTTNQLVRTTTSSRRRPRCSVQLDSKRSSPD
jgi:hypothetical protein